MINLLGNSKIRIINYLIIVLCIYFYLLVHNVLHFDFIKYGKLGNRKTDSSTFICTLEYDEFLEDRNDFIAISNHSKVQKQIIDFTELMVQYQSQHSMSALMSDTRNQICKRRFVWNLNHLIICDGNNTHNTTLEGVGSNLGQVLNELAVAIIFNRTFVLGPNDKFDDSCSKFITIRSWIPTYNEVYQLLSNAHCVDDFETPVKLFSIDNGNYNVSLIETHKSVVAYGEYLTHPYCLFHPRFGVILESHYLERVSKLFFLNDTNEMLIRYKIWGLLFKSLFSFTKLTQSIVRPIVDVMYYKKHKRKRICVFNDEILTIGVHLRHQRAESLNNSNLDEAFDLKALYKIYNITNELEYNRCVILVASDREASIELVRNYGRSIACEVYTVPNQDTSTAAALDELVKEHGPYAGNQVYLDLYLLSHAKYFIGSGFSTLSNLMHALIAAKRVPYSSYYNNATYWIRKEAAEASMIEHCTINEKYHEMNKFVEVKSEDFLKHVINNNIRFNEKF